MHTGRVRAALVGATTVVLVALAVGGLTRPSGGIGRGAPGAAATTTTPATPTTCLPVALPVVPAPSSRVVKIESPSVIAVSERDNGTEYDVPIGTVFNVRLVDSFAGSCARRSWQAPSADPPEVLRSPNDSDETLGSVATGSFDVVGPGLATISSQFQDCSPVCRSTSWSVSVRVASVTPSSLPRTG